MTIHEATTELRQQLEAQYEPQEARAIARQLLQHLTGLEPSRQVLHREQALTAEQQTALATALERLLRHEPLQYIIGSVEFMDCRITVTPDVLIPRPETEELVQKMLNAHGHEPHTVLDACTGSGCIPIALKKHRPKWKVHALDVSEEALKVAHKNASSNGTEVHFHKIDLLQEQEWQALPQVDVLVSNPPYVLDQERKEMLPHVLEQEPALALFVPNEDPFLFYRQLHHLLQQKLKSEGEVWLEINAALAEELAEEYREWGWKQVKVVPDLSGRNRFLRIKNLANC